MTKISVWASVLAAGATVGLVAYAVSRRTSSGQLAKSSSISEARRSASASPLSLTAPRGPIVADLGSPLAARRIEAVLQVDEEPTVQCLMKAPALIGSDDGEALDPDDLGGDWLARAAQSERSLREADLEVALEDLADTTVEADVPEDLEMLET